MASEKEEKEVKIFVDLDGVLADWEGGVLSKFGKPHKEVKSHILWSVIAKSKSFWRTLDKTHDFHSLWEYLKSFDISVLSGCPKSSFDNADIQKREWCKEHLGENVHVITCLAKNKQEHISNNGDILIDDNESNCKRWRDSGGISILHTDSESTIEKLKSILMK